VTEPSFEDLLRNLAPQVLGALTRRFGSFQTAEDAVQEALLAAATQWPEQGVPENPRGWLITVGSRRLTRTRLTTASCMDTSTCWPRPVAWRCCSAAKMPIAMARCGYLAVLNSAGGSSTMRAPGR